MFVSSFIDFMVNTFMMSVRDNTAQELRWLASAPGEMQGQMKAQLELQKEMELVQMLQRTFSAVCGWQKKEEMFSSERTATRTRTRYARA